MCVHVCGGCTCSCGCVHVLGCPLACSSVGTGGRALTLGFSPGPSLPLFFFLRPNLPVNQSLSSAGLAGQRASWTCLLLPLGPQLVPLDLAFDMGSGDRLRSHACAADTLLTEPSLQPGDRPSLWCPWWPVTHHEACPCPLGTG